MPTTLDADGVGRYPQEMEAAVYFCVLEALQNVAKYAGATRAEVRLAASGRRAAVRGDRRRRGLRPGQPGPTGRACRAWPTGCTRTAARSHVRSAPGAGTTIIGRLPCRVLEAAG